MDQKPPAPPSTNDDANDDSSSGNDHKFRHLAERGKKTATSENNPPPLKENPFLQEIDQMSPQELADYLYALAEEIIASPQEYKIKMGLEQLDINDLDNIDLNTPAGRRKLAALLRLLAEQVFRGKDVYQSTVIDSSKQQGPRTR